VQVRTKFIRADFFSMRNEVTRVIESYFLAVCWQTGADYDHQSRLVITLIGPILRRLKTI